MTSPYENEEGIVKLRDNWVETLGAVCELLMWGDGYFEDLHWITGARPAEFLGPLFSMQLQS